MSKSVVISGTKYKLVTVPDFNYENPCKGCVFINDRETCQIVEGCEIWGRSSAQEDLVGNLIWVEDN
jgi:hypothetical protein